MPVSSSGLAAGKNFPVHPRDLENESHRRKMVRGINQSAAGAFTPETQLDEMDTPVALDAVILTDLGVSLTVTPFIPARAHIFFVATAEFTTTSAIEIHLYENGGSVFFTDAPAAVGGTFMPIVIQALRDLQPDTTYTYTLVAKESGGEVTISADGTLTVRVEARRLGI